ncbi:MAG: ester cyclase [Chloroflexi bacterium]|nr:ester cyclase [Chloroflexota bacterium]
MRDEQEARNMAVVRRVFEELISKHQLDVAFEVFAPDYTFHDPLLPEPVRGPQGFRDLIAMYLDAVPDVQITIDDQFADGDMVTTRWTARGTQTGSMLGIPPTGKKYEMPGILLSRMHDGKIVQDWEYRDDLGMLRQVGAIKLPND